jgi:periplasmic copper chaperone A
MFTDSGDLSARRPWNAARVGPGPPAGIPTTRNDHPMTRRFIIAAATAASLAASFGVLAQDAFAQDGGGPKVEHPWARATPGQSKTGAAYLTIEGGTAPDKLVGVSTPAAGKAEIHTQMNESGVMKMHGVDGVAVPAGRKVELKPGSYHVMLMDLKHPLKEGESFPLTLTFEKAGKREVTVPVGKVGAMDDRGASR